MLDSERSRIVNKKLNLINVSDIVIHEKLGIGHVIKIIPHDEEDVLNPILVEFTPQCENPYHMHKSFTRWYDCNGEGSRSEDTVKFYGQLDLKNKEEVI